MVAGVHDIAGGGVGLVHQRCANDVNLGSHFSHFQAAVDSGGAIAIDQDLAVRLGFESLLGERQLVGAGREIRNRIRSGGLRYAQ